MTRASFHQWVLGVAKAMFLTIPLLLSGCFKDDLVVAELNNNPFDPEFDGPAVFALDTTYIQLLNGNVERQVFEFTVRGDLFLEPRSYEVYVEDLLSGTSEYVSQFPAGSHLLRYYRFGPVVGQEVCLRVSLSNNFHQGRAETICGTLQ
jgi:hypothetical protein